MLAHSAERCCYRALALVHASDLHIGAKHRAAASIDPRIEGYKLILYHGGEERFSDFNTSFKRYFFYHWQGRSQPNLPQRIWGSSELSTNLSRSRSLSSSNRNRPGSSMRPLPTIYSRPESRDTDSRPQSRADSRDQERLLDVRGGKAK